VKIDPKSGSGFICLCLRGCPKNTKGEQNSRGAYHSKHHLVLAANGRGIVRSSGEKGLLGMFGSSDSKHLNLSFIFFHSQPRQLQP
jgi:hypothetical protein